MELGYLGNANAKFINRAQDSGDKKWYLNRCKKVVAETKTASATEKSVFLYRIEKPIRCKHKLNYS